MSACQIPAIMAPPALIRFYGIPVSVHHSIQEHYVRVSSVSSELHNMSVNMSWYYWQFVWLNKQKSLHMVHRSEKYQR